MHQKQAASQQNTSSVSSADSQRGGRLERKCACGKPIGPTGECMNCRRERGIGIQTKLRINTPGDRYEQEADRVAEQVLSAQLLPAAPAAISPVSGSLQRQETVEEDREEDEEDLLAQRAVAVHDVPDVTPGIASQIASMRGHGQPLDKQAREYMEPRFGFDFSRVRVHTDQQAAQAAQAIEAVAFTTGEDIFFNTGYYRPTTESGARLLAHELVHVHQQRTAGSGLIQRLTFQQYYQQNETQATLIIRVVQSMNSLVEMFEAAYPLRDRRYRRSKHEYLELRTALMTDFTPQMLNRWLTAAGQLMSSMYRIREEHTGRRPNDDMLLRQREVVGDYLEQIRRTDVNVRGAQIEARRERRAEAAARQAREERTRSTEVSIGQVITFIRRYVLANYPAITNEDNRLRYGLAIARLLHHDLGTNPGRYIELFDRLRSQSPELYNLILFRGSTISYLQDMGVEGLEDYVYAETVRVSEHVILGAWDFDPETGQERDAPGVALIFDIIVGLVPLVGQVADARDIAGYIYRIGKYENQRSNIWTWVGLAGSILGLVPAVGDGAKSLLAAMRRSVTNVPVGRLSDDVIEAIARVVDPQLFARIIDASDNLTHILSLRWTIVQGRALNSWDRVFARMGPILAQVSDLSRAEIDLVRRAAREHLPETLQAVGRWLGQIVEALWIQGRITAAQTPDDIVQIVIDFRNLWGTTARSFNELWSPTARFLANLTPAERAAARTSLLRLAARESDEVAQGIRRLVDPDSVEARLPQGARQSTGSRVLEGEGPSPPISGSRAIVDTRSPIAIDDQAVRIGFRNGQLAICASPCEAFLERLQAVRNTLPQGDSLRYGFDRLRNDIRYMIRDLEDEILNESQFNETLRQRMETFVQILPDDIRSRFLMETEELVDSRHVLRSRRSRQLADAARRGEAEGPEAITAQQRQDQTLLEDLTSPTETVRGQPVDLDADDMLTEARSQVPGGAFRRVPRTVGRNDVVWIVDQNGHPTGGRAILRQLEAPPGRRPSVETQAQGTAASRGEPSDQGGHIFGYQFLGPQGEANLFPQSANLNMGAYETMESEWADWIRQGYEVHIEIRLIPTGSSRPTHIIYEYQILDPRNGLSLVHSRASSFANHGELPTEGRVPIRDM